LSQEQVPSLLIQHLPSRLRFTLQQKIARAAQDVFLQKLFVPDVPAMARVSGVAAFPTAVEC
jgi:hypothetical protein